MWCVAWAAGCDGPAASSGVAQVQTRGAALSDPAALVAALASQKEAGEEIYVVGVGGEWVFAQVLEAPPFADPARLIKARRGGALSAWLAPEVPIEDVQPVAGGKLYAITVDRELVELEATGHVSRVLDRQVQGPLSVARGGELVAYVRGEVPELVPVIREVGAEATREVEVSSVVWSVALSEDGTSITFVEGGESGARVVRADARGGAGREELRVEHGLFPVGPRAPLWYGQRLVFESEHGLVVREADGRVKQLNGALPVRLPGVQDALLVHRGSAPVLVRLDEAVEFKP
jgi:hypothetical protein